MSRRSRIRKRERKKRFYALHPKQKPITAKVSTASLITELVQSPRAITLSEVIEEVQSNVKA